MEPHVVGVGSVLAGHEFHLSLKIDGIGMGMGEARIEADIFHFTFFFFVGCAVSWRAPLLFLSFVSRHRTPSRSRDLWR
jgi:hypothetical protein